MCRSNSMLMSVSYVNPESVHQPTGYTHVVSVEGSRKTLYIAGQVAIDSKGKMVGVGDLEAQTRQVYENLALVLKKMGASFSDVVKQNIYTTRMDQLDVIRKIRSQYLPQNRLPASTVIGVTSLARKEFLIEIEMIAVLK